MMEEKSCSQTQPFQQVGRINQGKFAHTKAEFGLCSV